VSFKDTMNCEIRKQGPCGRVRVKEQGKKARRMIFLLLGERRNRGSHRTDPNPPMRATHILRKSVLLCAAFLCAGLGASPAHAEDIKSIHPTGYVTDLAGVIRTDQTAKLEALCTELEQKTGAQMEIVTVRSLDGQSVEYYAVDLFRQLGIGAKKDNRGVLLLVAPNDRKYRIEVGYGLEPIINDARAGDAGRAMVPSLRQGDYGSAIEAGAWELAKYIADDAHVTLSGQPPMRRVRQTIRGGGIGIFWLIVVMFILFSVIGRSSGRRPGGGSGSGLVWFLLGMLANSGRGSRGDWGGGGFGGGGGGFGGFGGGSSGGGGASGSW